MNRVTYGRTSNLPVGNNKSRCKIQQSKNEANFAKNNNSVQSKTLDAHKVSTNTKQVSIKSRVRSNTNKNSKKDPKKISPKEIPNKPQALINTKPKNQSKIVKPAPATPGPQPKPTRSPAEPKSGPKNISNPGGKSANNQTKKSVPNSTQKIPSQSTNEPTVTPQIDQEKTQSNTVETSQQANQISRICRTIERTFETMVLKEPISKFGYTGMDGIKLAEEREKLIEKRRELKKQKYMHILSEENRNPEAPSIEKITPKRKQRTPRTPSTYTPHHPRQLVTEKDARFTKLRLAENKKRLKEIDDQIYNRNIIPFFVKLSPQVINSTRSNDINAIFVEDLCKKIIAISKKTSESLEMLQISFRRLLEPGVLQAFTDHVNDYLQQIQAAQGDEALQARIEERLQAFVYNFLVPPYQEDREGSCFATAFLMNMWYNSPIDYMRFVRWAIDTDEPFDLAKIGGKGILDLRTLRKGNKRVAIKSILLAVVASLDESNETEKDIQASQIAGIATKEGIISKEDANRIAKAVMAQGIIYKDGGWLPLATCKEYNEKGINYINRIINTISEAVSDRPNFDTYKPLFGKIATRIPIEIRTESGGYSENIAKNWGKGQYSGEQVIPFEEPIENGVFTEEQFKPLSDALKSGPKGKFVIVTFQYVDEKGEPAGRHTCNITMDDYGILEPGEKKDFGHPNYIDSLFLNSRFFIKRTRSGGYEIINIPSNKRIKSATIRSGFEAKIMQLPTETNR